MDLGINLAAIRSYLPSPCLDIVRTGGMFVPQTPGNGTVLANGWPAGDTDGQMAGMFYFPTGEAEYTLKVTKGAASQVRIIKTSSWVPISEGKADFTMPGDGKAMQINIKPVVGAGETRIAIVRKDLFPIWEAGEIFNPDWYGVFKGFRSFRVMDWMLTNNSLVVDEFVPTDQAFLGKTGMPVELICALANKTGMRPRFNIPHKASDSWILALFAKIKANLDPKIPACVEYSNEVWNGDFIQNAYAKSQGKLLWNIEPTSSGACYAWYGYRSGQIAIMARGTGIRVGLGCQTAQPYMADKVWAGVGKSGAVDADFKEWLFAAYPNGDLTGNVTNTLTLAAAGDIDKGIENILHTGNGSVDGQALVYQAHCATAAKHFLEPVVYEGNTHVNALPNFGANLSTVLPYFKNLSASEGMAKVMNANLTAAEKAGVKTFNCFNDRQNWTEGGCFGLIGTPAWDAVLAYIQAHAGVSIQEVLEKIDAIGTELADLRNQVATLISA